MYKNLFLKYLQFEKRFSANTIKSYENDLRQFADFTESNFGEKQIHQVDEKKVRAWIVSLMGKDFSVFSINRKLSSLKTYFLFFL